MRVLFFIVHPSKFHLFRYTLAKLKQQGIEYDVLIASKDILAELLSRGGIPFTDLFPAGRRKIPGVPFYVGAAINLCRTLWRLYRHVRSKKQYDVFVTDDVLSILGKLIGIPSLVFTDNDLVTVKKVQAIYRFADRIIAPAATDLGKYDSKKIAFRGNKAIAHLHPAYFLRDPQVVVRYGLSEKRYAIVRVARLNASHDLHGNPGITDDDLRDLLSIMPEDCRIVLSAEREVAGDLRVYELKTDPVDFTQIMAHAAYFIGDSATMAAEAGVSGVPNVLVNNIASKCGVLKELQLAGLMEFFGTYAEAKPAIQKMLSDRYSQTGFQERAQRFISNCDDFNEVAVDAIVKLKKNLY
jgi:uncharacterized protein